MDQETVIVQPCMWKPRAMLQGTVLNQFSIPQLETSGTEHTTYCTRYGGLNHLWNQKLIWRVFFFLWSIQAGCRHVCLQIRGARNDSRERACLLQTLRRRLGHDTGRNFLVVATSRDNIISATSEFQWVVYYIQWVVLYIQSSVWGCPRACMHAK